MTAALALVLLGAAPSREEALYFAALVLMLLGDAMVLPMAVTSSFRPSRPTP